MTEQEAVKIIAEMQAKIERIRVAAAKQQERLKNQCDELGSFWDDDDGWQPCAVCTHYHGQVVCVEGLIVHEARFVHN